MSNFTDTLKSKMELKSDLTVPVFTTFIVFVLLVLRLMNSKSRRSANLPPQPWTLPLIGNLHQLWRTAPHVALRDLAKRYGPLITLQLGEVPTLIVSSSEVAKEVMKTHDINFASRPHMIVSKIVSYDSKNISFASYGDSWRELRKISTLELLSVKQVQSFNPIRDEEMQKLIKFISSNAGKSLDLSEKTSLMMHEIITRAVFGKSMDDDTQLFITLLTELVELATGISIADLFPSVKVLHYTSGLKPKLEAYHKEIDKILERIVRENESTKGLIYTLKNLKDDPESHVTSDHIKSVLLDILAGGSETSSTLVSWAMAELMKNPKVMEKVQKELRTAFDKQGLVDQSKLNELEYLNLVIKEVFRLHPPLPLLLPRQNKETCVVNGYKIPAKTKIIINAWAIGRDPKYWEDPDEFRPERFINNPVQFNGTSFDFMPFGAGRRMCPGVTFGLTSVEFYLANILFHFNWKLPNEMQANEIDMTESFGATVTRKEKLLLVPIPYERSSIAK